MAMLLPASLLLADDTERRWADLAGEDLNGKHLQLVLHDGREVSGKCTAVGAREIRIRLSDPPKDVESFPADQVQAIRVYRGSGTARTLLTIAGVAGGMFGTAAIVTPIGEGDTGRRQIAAIYGMGAAGGVAGNLIGKRFRKLDRTITIVSETAESPIRLERRALNLIPQESALHSPR